MGSKAKSPSDAPDRQQLHRIISGLTDGVVFVEPDHRIVWANEAALTMHGGTELAELGGTIEAYAKRFTLKPPGRRVRWPPMPIQWRGSARVKASTI